MDEREQALLIYADPTVQTFLNGLSGLQDAHPRISLKNTSLLLRWGISVAASVVADNFVAERISGLSGWTTLVVSFAVPSLLQKWDGVKAPIVNGKYPEFERAFTRFVNDVISGMEKMGTPELERMKTVLKTRDGRKEFDAMAEQKGAAKYLVRFIDKVLKGRSGMEQTP